MHQLQKVRLYHCHNEFTDERPNAHLPERRLKRESPDRRPELRGNSSRFGSSPRDCILMAKVAAPGSLHLLLRLLPRRRGSDLLDCPRLRIPFRCNNALSLR